LVLARDGGEIFVPFTDAICVEVDTEAGTIVIDPPDGLLELNEI
jgi:16S rRNA processing protein RimM